ncbi:MAG: SirB2 family protein [Cocleimonas sp.]|nr:SirB2 family protein [Cocleimonas sp.]
MLGDAHIILIWLSLLMYLLQGSLVLSRKQSKTMMTLASISSLTLFGTGIALVFMISNITFANGWVMTKLVGTLVYVSLGVLALKPGYSQSVAISLWLLGLLALIYTYSIAKLYVEPII